MNNDELISPISNHSNVNNFQFNTQDQITINRQDSGISPSGINATSPASVGEK
jgi:hypothetical protein